MGKKMIKGRHAVGGCENYLYYPTPLVLAEAVASYDSEPVISFGFGWEEAVATANGYTNLRFVGFARVVLLDSPWDFMGGAGE